MRGVMADPSQRKKRELHTGPPCPHYPHKYKTEAAHQGKVASRRRNHHRSQQTSAEYRLKALLRTVYQRCNDPRHASYKWYGGAGITASLTLKELRHAWQRDGAAKMTKPSIDRKDRLGNYDAHNIEFIEFRDNLDRRVFAKDRPSQYFDFAHAPTPTPKEFTP